jgi:hypothetical protein
MSNYFANGVPKGECGIKQGMVREETCQKGMEDANSTLSGRNYFLMWEIFSYGDLKAFAGGLVFRAVFVPFIRPNLFCRPGPMGKVPAVVLAPFS